MIAHNFKDNVLFQNVYNNKTIHLHEELNLRLL